MAKKAAVETKAEGAEAAAAAPKAKSSRKRLDQGILYVVASFNNTKVLLADTRGNAVAHSSSGALGFTGAKKGTPFAAAKAAEILAEKAEAMGLKVVDVVVKGVGAGRESAIRSFVSRGVQIRSIVDRTPVPHNGPTRRKARRV